MWATLPGPRRERLLALVARLRIPLSAPWGSTQLQVLPSWAKAPGRPAVALPGVSGAVLDLRPVGLLLSPLPLPFLLILCSVNTLHSNTTTNILSQLPWRSHLLHHVAKDSRSLSSGVIIPGAALGYWCLRSCSAWLQFGKVSTFCQNTSLTI